MSSKKYKRRKKHDRLVLNILIIVALVLVIFEGKLIVTMTTHRSTMQTASSSAAADGSEPTPESSGSSDNADTPETNNDSAAESGNGSSHEAILAGLPSDIKAPLTSSSSEADKLPTVSDPDSSAIVPKASPAVDDSYFSDAVFIGDSRMEGFRMASGITQGQFFTSIGMSLSGMRSESIISTSDGNITVAAALSGGSYKKVYIMLGTNDLGEYDWPSFKEGFISVMKRFRELQPDAVFYICSVIYLEESKVSDTTYINNTNVDKINSILLEICEEEGLYYLNLNEILSNGYGALIDGASSDGVHLNNTYCKQMLDYMKNHYIEVKETSKKDTEAAETETETE